MANVNTPISQLPTVVAIDGSEIVPLDQGGTTKQATIDQIINGGIQTNFPGAIEFVIDGGSASIAPGVKGYLTVPFNATLNYIEVFVSPASTFSIDVWQCTYDQYDGGVTHPVASDSILQGSYPTITADTKTMVSYGGVPTITAGNVLAFNVRNAVGVSKATIALNITRQIT